MNYHFLPKCPYHLADAITPLAQFICKKPLPRAMQFVNQHYIHIDSYALIRHAKGGPCLLPRRLQNSPLVIRTLSSGHRFLQQYHTQRDGRIDMWKGAEVKNQKGAPSICVYDAPRRDSSLVTFCYNILYFKHMSDLDAPIISLYR